MRMSLKFILFLLIVGFSYWVLDSLTHLLFTEGLDFLDLMVGNGASHEFYHRVLLFGVISISALFFFRLLLKQQKTQIALQESIKTVREERDKAQRYLDVAGVILMVQNEQGHVTLINKKGCEVLGYPEAEILGKDWFEHFIPARLRQSARNIFVKQITGTGSSQEKYEGDILLSNGELRTIEWYTTVLCGKENQNVGILSSGEDVTERKHAGEALKTMYEESLKASRLKSDLLAFATHELKTPLVPIIGWTEFIKVGLENGKKLDEMIGKEEISSIYNAAQRLSKIIDNFLEMGQIENNPSNFQLLNHYIAEILNYAIKSVTPLANSRRIKIQNKSINAEVHVDAFRIEQAFINILSNAIKYSPEDSEIMITSRQSNSNYDINITDQGEGFTQEELRTPWKPFSPLRRVNLEGTQQSSGIGLYLTKNIIEQNKGTIHIMSEGRGRGTTVTISLPLESEQAQ